MNRTFWLLLIVAVYTFLSGCRERAHPDEIKQLSDGRRSAALDDSLGKKSQWKEEVKRWDKVHWLWINEAVPAHDEQEAYLMQ